MLLEKKNTTLKGPKKFPWSGTLSVLASPLSLWGPAMLCNYVLPFSTAHRSFALSWESCPSNIPTAGSTVLLASRATCIRPTRMWAMSEVRPGWISTTWGSHRGVNTSGVQLIVIQMSLIVSYLFKDDFKLEITPFGSYLSVTLAVQLVWVILPEVEMVWVKIFPSSGIQGPQMLSSV